jgi:hypothetical protein
VGRWTCPFCEREFGRERQGHDCVPGNTVDETFAGARAWQRPVFDAVLAHATSLGPVHVDAVAVGVFLKHQRTFVELRPMARALSANIVLPRAVTDARVTRRISASASRVVHVVRMRAAADVDDQVRDWLTESYLAAG